MEKLFRKTMVVLLAAALLCGMTGCNGDKDAVEVTKQEAVQETVGSRPLYVEGTEESTQASTGEHEEESKPDKSAESETVIMEQEEIQPEQVMPPKSIEYGDTITFSCNKEWNFGEWKYTGEEEFQVASTAKQFQNEFDFSEEVTMKNVEQAIGKVAGDTFTLWFEGGDGRYGYEYTIVDVVSSQPDKVEYGDKVFATYVMRGLGVDTGEGDMVFSGEQVIRVVDTNTFLAVELGGYSLSTAQGIIDDIIGKSVRDTFWVKHESGASIHNYKFNICGISKAVKYGDTIKTEVRKAGIPAEEREQVAGEKFKLELMTSTGTLNLAGDELDLKETRKFFKEMQGKTVGDRVIIENWKDSSREVYSIEILAVEPGKTQETENSLEILMLAEEEAITFFYEEDEYRDRFSEPVICYAIINDSENHMVYEYSLYDKSYYMNRSYSYEPEYDTQGRLIKETYVGDWDRTYEYKYNEKGVCVEIKTSYPNSQNIDYTYYDETGNFIRSERIYSGGKESCEYVEGNPNRIQMTEYDAEGNAKTYIREKDDWGF